MAEVTILGLGNLLWADEGFGVRAAEKLFEQYADNEILSRTPELPEHLKK